MPLYNINAVVWSDESDLDKVTRHVDDVLWTNFDDVFALAVLRQGHVG